MKRGEGDPWKKEKEEEEQRRRRLARAHTQTCMHTKRDKEYQEAEQCTSNRVQITARGANRRGKNGGSDLFDDGRRAGLRGGGADGDGDEEKRKKAQSRRRVRRSEGAGETDVAMAD